MTLHGHIENGGIKFDPPIALPDGAAVEVQLQILSSKTEEQSTGTSEPPTLLERMKDFVGTFEGLPADASTNLDHYLYGSPKRQ